MQRVTGMNLNEMNIKQLGVKDERRFDSVSIEGWGREGVVYHSHLFVFFLQWTETVEHGNTVPPYMIRFVHAVLKESDYKSPLSTVGSLNFKALQGVGLEAKSQKKVEGLFMVSTVRHDSGSQCGLVPLSSRMTIREVKNMLFHSERLGLRKAVYIDTNTEPFVCLPKAHPLLRPQAEASHAVTSTADRKATQQLTSTTPSTTASSGTQPVQPSPSSDSSSLMGVQLPTSVFEALAYAVASSLPNSELANGSGPLVVQFERSEQGETTERDCDSPATVHNVQTNDVDKDSNTTPPEKDDDGGAVVADKKKRRRKDP